MDGRRNAWKILDLAGQRFGRLVAIQRLQIQPNQGYLWECCCDCGNTINVSVNRLRSGNTKSCGCLVIDVNTLNLAGQRFGSLTVIRTTEQRATNGGMVWECICDCGTTYYATVSGLKGGNNKSCGCHKSRDAERVSYNVLRSVYICAANKRNLDFLLTDEEFMSLCKGDCYYCGKPPSQIKHIANRIKQNTEHCKYNGIDRIDSKKGYTIDNVVSCCKLCNRAKNVLGLEEFINMCKRVAARHG